MLKAIWPSIAHSPNHLPPNASITSSGMVQSTFFSLKNVHVSSGLLCYFIYWSIKFPFMFVSPPKIRYFCLAKAIIVPPTWLALLIWAFVKVLPSISLLTPKNTLSGNELRWAWLSAFNSALGFFATAGLNMPNFTVSNRILYDHPYPSDNHIRDMRKAKGRTCNYDLIQTRLMSFLTQHIQLPLIPIAFTLASYVGNAVTSAGVSLYNKVLWDPLKLIDHWNNRACAFFTSLTLSSLP